MVKHKAAIGFALSVGVVASPAYADHVWVYENCCTRTCSVEWVVVQSGPLKGNTRCDGVMSDLSCPAAMVPTLNKDPRRLVKQPNGGTTLQKTGQTSLKLDREDQRK